MLAHHVFYRLIKAWMRVLVLIQIHNKCSHLTFFNFRFGHMYIILNLSLFHHIRSYLLSSLEWQIWAQVLNLLIPHYICKWSKFPYRFQALLWYVIIYNMRSNDNSDEEDALWGHRGLSMQCTCHKSSSCESAYYNMCKIVIITMFFKGC